MMAIVGDFRTMIADHGVRVTTAIASQQQESDDGDGAEPWANIGSGDANSSDPAQQGPLVRAEEAAAEIALLRKELPILRLGANDTDGTAMCRARKLKPLAVCGCACCCAGLSCGIAKSMVTCCEFAEYDGRACSALEAVANERQGWITVSHCSGTVAALGPNSKPSRPPIPGASSCAPLAGITGVQGWTPGAGQCSVDRKGNQLGTGWVKGKCPASSCWNAAYKHPCMARPIGTNEDMVAVVETPSPSTIAPTARPPPTIAPTAPSWPTTKPTKRPECNDKAAGNNMKLKSRASALLTPLGLQPWSLGIDASGFLHHSEASCRTRLAKLEQRQKIPFPVVVKPVAGLQGKGVETGVKDVAGICAAIKRLLGKSSRTSRDMKHFLKLARRSRAPLLLVEEMVFGNNYRVFVYRGRVIDVVYREMATVKGDGKATLATLIARRNTKQRRQRLHPVKFVSWDMIATRYKLKRGSIVKRGKKVQITMVGNFHNGCNPFHVPPVVEILRNTFFFQIERAALHSYGPGPHSC